MHKERESVLRSYILKIGVLMLLYNGWEVQMSLNLHKSSNILILGEIIQVMLG